ncbi:MULTISPECIES: F0F1 ATP synthase subunit B [Hahella]|uniref:ATP synthase subunit b n=1 Tax=Hahella chejuensis (strain KCTC 2396) TaxID=349521 RepID=ATPF_HAHCH|nr:MULTISPECIES: F0F1 ATP synthase subunit B [Hahella]Q2S6N7.1 RecName: Full=ATP synthase subunit b; AltName: Full=ATP synthase F(0) sector subunit b; AltName: Full=ATPase subunit I; AltName: Full=F-type ATPase subunit b; Short=F-ATPase subunit b [Hahella chejuensis KCTC 2396]MBU6951774.1 F0F1 ATP synthase subunit B [Hahella sp. HN01]ABC33687.1 F0F1-type ATP synthase, subunit b [Hahella chejuensis KCTC 2396]MDG9666510.1 F0F1 ATP synthase subunit B [Hahella sp. CR1]WLQ13074.1 F0F1 ATP synthase 
MNINLTMIGQAIAFFIFVVFCMKYVWPPVIQALREREKKIADGLQAAEHAQKDLELAQEKVAKQLREAKQQAAEIIEQANKRANQMLEEAKDQARTEGERLITAAKAEIDQEKNRAKESLRAEVAALALAGAEKILETSVDAGAHSNMLDKLAAEL